MFPSPNDYSQVRQGGPLATRHAETCRYETPTRQVSYSIENIKVRFTFAKGLLEKPDTIVINNIAEHLGAIGETIHYTPPQIGPG